MKKVIAVIAPANTMADVPMTMREIGSRNLAWLDYAVKLGRNVDRRWFHTSGTLAERLDDFGAAVADPTVELVMPVFGGHNSNQLLRHLDYDAIAASRKSFVGYSDIVVLLLAIRKLSGNRCLHGPSFAVFCDPNLFPYTSSQFVEVMAGRCVTFVSPQASADDAWYLKERYGPRELLPCDGWKVFREGEVVAPINGGNLETLLVLAGTRFFPELAGRILFVEETSGNNPGGFHQRMTQLSDMGMLRDIEGLIIGKVPAKSRLASVELMEAILDDVLQGTGDYPVLYDVHCSHVDPMLTIPLDEPARLTTDPFPSLTVNLGGQV